MLQVCSPEFLSGYHAELIDSRHQGLHKWGTYGYPQIIDVCSMEQTIHLLGVSPFMKTFTCFVLHAHTSNRNLRRTHHVPSGKLT